MQGGQLRRDLVYGQTSKAARLTYIPSVVASEENAINLKSWSVTTVTPSAADLPPRGAARLIILGDIAT